MIHCQPAAFSTLISDQFRVHNLLPMQTRKFVLDAYNDTGQACMAVVGLQQTFNFCCSDTVHLTQSKPNYLVNRAGLCTSIVAVINLWRLDHFGAPSCLI